MGTSYDTDIVAWANEQAALLRAGDFDAIDVLNIAEEIEDVGKSVQQELASRFSVLVAHLLKWSYQRALRSAGWKGTIAEQRRKIERRLRRTPSLKHTLADPDWLDEVWEDGVQLARKETGLEMPGDWVWTLDQVMDPEFYPD